jgi:hypothetical protein
VPLRRRPVQLRSKKGTLMILLLVMVFTSHSHNACQQSVVTPSQHKYVSTQRKHVLTEQLHLCQLQHYHHTLLRHYHYTADHCRSSDDSDDDDDEQVDEEAIQASVTRQGRTVQGNEGAPTKTRLQELGPRFTLKLRWLQEGTFDTEFGEYEWVHKRKEMDSSRRKFHL